MAADNVNITPGTGAVVAADSILVDGTHTEGLVQFVKLVDGTLNGTGSIRVNQAAKANALTVAPASDISDATYIGDIKFGEAVYTEDVATPATIIGLATVMERDDALGGLTPAEGDWVSLRCDANGALWVHDNVVNTLLTTIDSDTGNMLTALQLLDNAIDGNYLNVNLNAAGTDLSMNSGVLTAQTLRVTIATDDECNNFLGAIDADTSNMVTALQIMDDWDDSDKCKVIIQTGSNAIGKLATNTGVDIGDVDVTSIIPLTGATNLGKARDVACGANDVGVMALAVRDDTLTTLTPADGDYAPLRLSSTGQLHVTDANITACNTGAVVISSGTVTTVSTVTNLSQMSGVAISMNEGALGTGVQRVTLATDDDAVAHLATIAGDTTNIETAIQIIDDWDVTHDSAVSADGPQMMAAYDSTKPTAVDADADAVRILADAYGRLLVGVEPQRFQAVFDSANATAEANVVHASAGSTIIVIQSYIISSDVEGWIKLQDESSTALTGKFWLKAGGGVAITLPDKAPIVLGSDKDLEVICEAAGNVSVSVTGYTIPG